MGSDWNVPALILGVFVAFGLVGASVFMATYLTGYWVAIGPVLLWIGVGAFYLGLKRARRRRGGNTP